MDKVAVRFTRSYSPYTAGEVAGFAPDKADRLVRAGAATYFDRQMEGGGRKKGEKQEPKEENQRRQFDGNQRQRHSEGAEVPGTRPGDDPPGTDDTILRQAREADVGDDDGDEESDDQSEDSGGDDGDDSNKSGRRRVRAKDKKKD